MPSRSGPATPATRSASSTTGITWTTWLRLASSGTTPPQRRWISIWVETTSESTRRPSSTTAAAVSSQLVSIPRTFTGGALCTAPGQGRKRSRRARTRGACRPSGSTAR